MKLRLASAGHAHRHRPARGAQGRPGAARRRLRDRRADDLRGGARRRPRSTSPKDAIDRDRRRPGPQPRHRRRRDRPCRSGVGPAGARPRPRLLELVLRSARGERVVPLDGFFEGAFQTGDRARRDPRRRCAAGRCRTARPARTGSSTQPASGYSIVGVAAVVATSGGVDQRTPAWRSPGWASVAYRAKAVEAALLGTDGSPAAIAAAAAHATDGVTVNSDIHADREYRTADGRGLHATRDRGRARPLPPDADRQHRVRVERVTPGRRAPARLVGAVLTRDLVVGDAALVEGPPPDRRRPRTRSRRAEPGAARHRPHPRGRRAARGRRRAATRQGRRRPRPGGPRPEPEPRGPARRRRQASSTSGSRSSSGSTGSTRSRSSPGFDGQVVRARRPRRQRQGRPARRRRGRPWTPGHGSPASAVAAARLGRAVHRRAASASSSRSRSVRATARERFEASVRAKVEGLGSSDRRDRLRRRRRGGRRGRAGRGSPSRPTRPTSS